MQKVDQTMHIQFDHITRVFNDYKAVDDVSFSINQGEIVGLLGHNGAGKTTVMKMLTGYLEASHGEIFVDGLSIRQNLRRIQTFIGYLPENCPLWPDMSIVEFLIYQASLKGIAKSELDDQVYQVIKQTNLSDKAMQTIATLSKGYRQRVGVASAILNQPKIIILDEPTNGLDPRQTLNMRSLIQKLAKTSTVILSTHILQEVEAVCERVIILRSGKVITDKKLKALDQIQGLRITIDQDIHRVRTLFADLINEDGIQLIDNQAGRYQYLLDVDITLSAKVSQAILQAGYQLLEITPQRENLESLFKQDYVIQASLNSEEVNVG